MNHDPTTENRISANLVKYLSNCQGKEEVSKQWLQLNSGLESEFQVLRKRTKAKIQDIQQRHRSLYGTAVLVHEQTTQLLRCCESLLKHTEHPISPSDSGFLFVEWMLKQRSLTASAEDTIKSAVVLLQSCCNYLSESPFSSSSKSILGENQNMNQSIDSYTKFLNPKTSLISGTTVESSLKMDSVDELRNSKLISFASDPPNPETQLHLTNVKNEDSVTLKDIRQTNFSFKRLNSSPLENVSKNFHPVESDDHQEPSKKRRRRAVRLLQDSAEKDTWEWRKYGQKPIKDSPLFRSYYRCNRSREGCTAKKMVDHHAHDATPARVFIEGDHSHPPVAYSASKLFESIANDTNCDDASNCTIEEKETFEAGEDRNVSESNKNLHTFDFMGVGRAFGSIQEGSVSITNRTEINGSDISIEEGC